MSKQWKRLHSSLHAAEGRDFERMALPFIRAIWAEAIIPQSLRSTYDKSGVDILVWNGIDTLSITLAVQCKGFAVKAHELGNDQIRQCKDSINTFREVDSKRMFTSCYTIAFQIMKPIAGRPRGWGRRQIKVLRSRHRRSRRPRLRLVEHRSRQLHKSLPSGISTTHYQ